MNTEQRKSLYQALSIKKERVISVTGAGGKTSVIYSLANDLAAIGYSILITTTTAMFHPDKEKRRCHTIVTGDVEKVMSSFPKPGKITIAAASILQPEQKLLGFKSEEIDRLKKTVFDFILIEADGSKQLPVKAPAAHEPVIPSSTGIVIGVIGLDCLGQPINSNSVHRADLFSEIAGIPIGSPITKESIRSLVYDSQGLFKNALSAKQRILILNKADNQDLLQQGVEAANIIFDKTGLLDSVLVCCLKQSHPVLKISN